MKYVNIRAMTREKIQIGCVTVALEENESIEVVNQITEAENYDDLFRQIKELGLNVGYKEYHKGQQYKLIINKK